MPSTSKKQHNFMAAVSANPKFAKKVGVPQTVGAEFIKADKGKKFLRGGEMAESKKMMAKEVAFMKKKGAPKSMVKHEETEYGMKKGGKVKKMAAGGDTTMSNPSRERRGMTMEKMGKVTAGGKRAHGEHSVQQKGHTKAKQVAMKRGGMCGK